MEIDIFFCTFSYGFTTLKRKRKFSQLHFDTRISLLPLKMISPAVRVYIQLVCSAVTFIRYGQEDKLTNRESDDLVVIWSFRFLHWLHEGPSIWVCL